MKEIDRLAFTALAVALKEDFGILRNPSNDRVEHAFAVGFQFGYQEARHAFLGFLERDFEENYSDIGDRIDVSLPPKEGWL